MVTGIDIHLKAHIQESWWTGSNEIFPVITTALEK
jgi:hypothetical protein